MLCVQPNPKTKPHNNMHNDMVGDAGAILRVHEFLDRWGLINAQVRSHGSGPGVCLSVRCVNVKEW